MDYKIARIPWSVAIVATIYNTSLMATVCAAASVLFSARLQEHPPSASGAVILVLGVLFLG